MKNKNPFDELIELHEKKSETLFDRFDSRDNSMRYWYYMMFRVDDGLLSEWDEMPIQVANDIVYMTLLFAREMWEDGQR